MRLLVATVGLKSLRIFMVLKVNGATHFAEHRY
jgi:hypothetical protein